MDKSPHDFAGNIVITWLQPSSSGILPGWGITLTDAVTGEPIQTVTAFRVVLHANAQDLVWAECDMFATPDGKPAYEAPAMGPPLIGTFPFLVKEMRVAGAGNE